MLFARKQVVWNSPARDGDGVHVLNIWVCYALGIFISYDVTITAPTWHIKENVFGVTKGFNGKREIKIELLY